MLKRLAVYLCIAAILVSSTTAAAGHRRRPKDEGGDPKQFSDWAVEQAIRRGIDYLWKSQAGSGSFSDYGPHSNETGASALVTYALLAAGVNPQDPRMEKALKYLADKEPKGTYALGLRCYAFHLANRNTLGKYREALKKDAKILVERGIVNGAYSYTGSGGDNSNSQYGLLGVWAAAADGIEIPSEYWQKVTAMWEGRQGPNGAWGYQGPGSARPQTMTLAGLASLLVCYDYSGQADANPGKPFPHVQKGLKWEEDNYGLAQFPYYQLYGIERVGLAAGYKYFGKHDWYKEGAQWLLNSQGADGSWKSRFGGGPPGTAFALLFLIRGRHPVLFNKLQHGGDWNRRQRDMAAVTRWVSNNFETSVNWQIIDTDHPIDEWEDASILYITGTTDPKFTADDFEKIKAFVQRGGMIFTVVQRGGTAFNQAMKYAYTKMFPADALKGVSADHPLYHMYFEIKKPSRLSEVHNGARPLAVHCEEDLAATWMASRVMQTKLQREYCLAFNIAQYGVDRVSSLPPRGNVKWPRAANVSKTIEVTQIQHGGRWNPEPLALKRFADMMSHYAGTGITVKGPTALADLPGCGTKVALMTGSSVTEFTDDEAAALARYVFAGGTVIIDAAGGSESFNKSVQDMLARAFPNPHHRLSRLPGTAPVYAIDGHEIETCGFRGRTASDMTERHPRLDAILVGGGRAGVIYSRLDITCGLAGSRSGAINGYDAYTAFDLMRNAVLYGNSVQAEAETPPAPAAKSDTKTTDTDTNQEF